MRLHLLLLLATAMAMAATAPADAYNITKILSAHPEFSTFNHYLSLTHLASDVNRRLTVTVLALDNSAMSSLLDRHLSLPTLRNVLALHCLVDYYGAKKLHQLTSGTALTSSLFQATGAAPGTTGFVNITDRRGGHVTFSAEDTAADDADDGTTTTASASSSFVKSVKEIPYNLSIVQISAALSSPEAEAPAAAPAPVNLTAAMSRHGCGLFAGLLLAASPDVLDAYESNLDTGLTVFCPVDAAVRAFGPKFGRLKPDERATLLLYHAEAAYNSMQQLKTGSGLSTTLATAAAAAKKKKSKDFTFTVGEDGGGVKLETEVATAKILKTVVDQEPVAVYSINKVLQPRELFKPPEAGAPAGSAAAAAAAAAADSPDGAPDDDKAADDNAADGRLGGGCVWAVAAAAAAVAVML
ncbi:putative fasciclin-like arabinogalactan protein 1 [Iris pallida]|uniref:Fasciclin-like arabinogalactan protein 1 n=1 Tax=Iris pallida TaxID=29817 RepID=A0AAX6FUH4_IRIPA|nr:putative fasciclin-like arabinogalactan protein 1 [Iris pallida]